MVKERINKHMKGLTGFLHSQVQSLHTVPIGKNGSEKEM